MTTTNKGFTLVEMAVVTAIIAVLGVVAAGYYQDYIRDSRYAVVRTNLRAIRDSISTYFKQNMEYPTNLKQLKLNTSVEALTLWILQDPNAQLMLNIADSAAPKYATASNPFQVPAASTTYKTLTAGSQAFLGNDSQEQQFNDIKISGSYQTW